MSNPILNFARWGQLQLDRLGALDFIAPLLLRIYLAPVLWMAGTQKLSHFADTVEWFGNSEWGLGLPFPALMASLAIGAEIGGAISLVLGLALRWMCIPMMFTMLVAAFSVHWMNGWLAIAEGMGAFATQRTMEAHERLEEAKQILMEHGDWDRLTEFGNFVILNNGVEFAVTYFIMLLALAFLGAGRYVSLDWWIRRQFMPPASAGMP
ncbi:MAG TPA: DoxX family protein [Solimonas sp.]|nr:DoxX family protein [Solimonas sp.]